MDGRIKRTASLTETTAHVATEDTCSSDTDEVIDFLHTNVNATKTTKIHVTNEFNKNSIPATTTIINLENNHNSGLKNTKMIPTINVTPHSPAATNKYNNLFEDTLLQLQNIRESVVQMKNSSIHFTDYQHTNSSYLSSSLPNLTTMHKKLNLYNAGASGGAGGTGKLNAAFLMWSPQQQQYLLNTDRRKSWTAADDAVVSGDCTNKSISLSSLDSEEQETIRGAEQRRRHTRNSAGGVSTHSLNEAELVRDFDQIAAKRNLVTEALSRIPLQKSISTSSIVAKDDIKGIGRHLTDSEDENQGLLRAHAKIEVYDNVEKRRKRGSIFFRKKKDKSKNKTMNNANDTNLNIAGMTAVTCDICGATIGNNSNMKEHQLECAKVKKFISAQKINFMAGGIKKGSNDVATDYEASGSVLDYNADDAPLIRAEFLNEPPIEAHDLGADPLLGIDLEEHDSWSPGVAKELLKTLKEKQIKRQEHIYEFIMTEKHHCQTLLVMQKIFVESLERHFSGLNVNAMFPRLSELSLLHTDFLRQLRKKQRASIVVESIADILLDFFGAEKAQKLRQAYGEFCANHRSALEQFKNCMTSRDQRFAQWYKHCLTNPLLKKKGIPECILFVTQRLTKYPLLIEPLLKSARENNEEVAKLQQALNMVKALLVDVDACVAERELSERQIELVQRVDAKSFTIYRHKPFRKSDLSIETGRRLKFEGLASLLQGRSKVQLVLVVVLTDCLCFLVENSSHKYTFFTPEHKAGVVPLQKLLIREKAGTESRGIYIISSNPEFPEMYELKVQQPKDKQVWIQSIRQAVLNCTLSPLRSTEETDQYSNNQEQQSISKEQRQEIIEQLRQKDIELALLLEDKLQLHIKTTITKVIQNQEQEEQPLAAQLLSIFNKVSYKDLVNSDTDTALLWQRVQQIVEDIMQLATIMYQTVNGGLQVNRMNTFVENFATSPLLPKRAETFAGFDEKRAKVIFPNSNKLMAMQQKLTPRLQELEEKRQTHKTSNNTQQPHVELTADKDEHLNNLQIANNLHMLLCIISQQMTTIEQLKLQLTTKSEIPARDQRAGYTHNDQLEELRNLQDKLQEEKTTWTKHLQQEKQDLEEKRLAQLQLHEAIKREQEDIKQQREQLYRKMELLSSQGLLISPNTMIVSPVLSGNNHDAHENDGFVGTPTTSTAEKRKDKWRASSVSAKTAPANLLSASNAPKISQQAMKQKIPIKLSSLSSTGGQNTTSTKIDKSASFSINNSNGIHSGTVTQLFPLKLADKTSSPVAAHTQVQHTRTGSSPAIIQQHTASLTANKNIVRSVTNTTTIANRRHTTNVNETKRINAANTQEDNKVEEQEIYF